MNYNFSIPVNSVTEQYRFDIPATDKFKSYTGGYIGEYTYCVKTIIDNGIQFGGTEQNKLCYNLQIGKYNSIADGFTVIFGRNHNIKRISTGALDLMFCGWNSHGYDEGTSFNQKGSIIVQNDVWIGQNVTIMAGVTVGNGAVIARNSHVVSNVPPYAVVGGNPAKVIGYRYTKEQIDKMLKIQWWNWDKQKLIQNRSYFSEDIEGFCNKFYPEAEEIFLKEIEEKRILENVYDGWFVFVDYYENYCSYPLVMESFLEHFINNEDKKLILFIRTDCEKINVSPIDKDILNNINMLMEDIKNDTNIKCTVEVRMGTFEDAKKAFMECKHYITGRTYDTVYFSSKADLYGMDTISGTDSLIQFEKRSNMIKQK